MTPIFDTHAHYNDKAFEADREAVVAALPQNGVGTVIEYGIDFDSCMISLDLGHRYPHMYVALGIHPQSLLPEMHATTTTKFHGDWRAEMAAIRPYYDDPKVVAVGECGLDHFYPIPRDEQIALFRAELELARELDLPILMHDREAHGDTYPILKEYRPKGILHCYSGSAQDVAWLAEQGLYFGFGGATTYKNAHHTLEAVAAVPDELFLLETDSPYMTPNPVRKERNTSANILHVANKLAEVRGTTAEELIALASRNAHRLFNIPE